MPDESETAQARWQARQTLYGQVLSRAQALEAVLVTPHSAAERAEQFSAFHEVMDQLHLLAPVRVHQAAHTFVGAANRLGFVLIDPGYTIESDRSWDRYVVENHVEQGKRDLIETMRSDLLGETASPAAISDAPEAQPHDRSTLLCRAQGAAEVRDHLTQWANTETAIEAMELDSEDDASTDPDWLRDLTQLPQRHQAVLADPAVEAFVADYHAAMIAAMDRQERMTLARGKVTALAAARGVLNDKVREMQQRAADEQY